MDALVLCVIRLVLLKGEGQNEGRKEGRISDLLREEGGTPAEES